MAYARFGDDCDVYVFSTGGELLCMDCALGPDLKAKTTAGHDFASLRPLEGRHKVRDDVFTGLAQDQEENDTEFS